MQPVGTYQNGLRLYVVHQTAHYVLFAHRFANVELLRTSDNATCFFQGDDAALWWANMRSIESVRQGSALDESFDCLCSGYDDVLTVDE